jgi:hypothetical protein
MWSDNSDPWSAVVIIIVGLVILIVAVVAGMAGVLSNDGIVVGAAGVLGLTLLLAGARRTSRRGRAARRGLKESRRQTATVSRGRGDLLGQRQTAPPAPAVNGHPVPDVLADVSAAAE